MPKTPFFSRKGRHSQFEGIVHSISTVCSWTRIARHFTRLERDFHMSLISIEYIIFTRCTDGDWVYFRHCWFSNSKARKMCQKEDHQKKVMSVRLWVEWHWFCFTQNLNVVYFVKSTQGCIQHYFICRIFNEEIKSTMLSMLYLNYIPASYHRFLFKEMVLS